MILLNIKVILLFTKYINTEKKRFIRPYIQNPWFNVSVKSVTDRIYLYISHTPKN